LHLSKCTKHSVLYGLCERSKKDILPFCISHPAIFPEQIALCFHLFGSYAAIHVKETKERIEKSRFFAVIKSTQYVHNDTFKEHFTKLVIFFWTILYFTLSCFL